MRVAVSIALCFGGLAAAATVAVAQQETADASWAAGDYNRAKAAYEQVLVNDPNSVRANYRLGVLASWDNHLDSALVLIRRARQNDPGDPDIRLTEAQVLAWAGRYDEALARYDSIMVDHPDRAADAHLGKGRIYYWQDRLELARSESGKALAADPQSQEANKLDDDINGAGRVVPEFSLGWSHDSDDNNTWWQSVTASMLIRDGLRGFATVGALEATDPIRKSTRLSAEAGVKFGVASFGVTTAVGLRQLLPGGAPNRTAPTWRIGAAKQLSQTASATISYSHIPFDETAFLMGRELDMDIVDLGADVRLRPGLELGSGFGHTWFSDGNSRTSGVVAVTRNLPGNFTAGVFGRMMGYEFHGVGYFSPDRLTVLEGRGGYSFTDPVWRGRVTAGLGVQQVGKGAKAQLEGHVDGRVGRDWGGANRVDFFAGFSTSAESSTTGAFRYYSAGIVATIAF